MTAKDYAKQISSKKTKGKSRYEIIIVAILIALLGGTIGIAYLNKLFPYILSKNTFSSAMAEVKNLVSRYHAPLINQQKAKPLVKEHQEENEIQFQFYEELPKIQVGQTLVKNTEVVTSADTTPEKKPEEVQAMPPASATVNSDAHAEQFILQFGIFSDPSSANALRISLLLSGADAEWVKEKIDNRERYRVLLGPYDSMTKAREVQKKLQKKGVQSVLKKIH